MNTFSLSVLTHFVVLQLATILTLKLAGYFATRIQAIYRGSLTPPPKNYETANNKHMSFGMQLVHDLLINLHSNNHHLISHCCHGNKKSKMAADGRHLGFSIFEILLNIKRFCLKQLGNIILSVETII